MTSIKVAVGGDHLGFHPQSELKAKVMDFLAQPFQSTRKFLEVDAPVAQGGKIVVAL
jgi:hypothetical protein